MSARSYASYDLTAATAFPIENQQIVANAKQGHLVVRKDASAQIVVARLQVVGDRYVMTSRTGEHSLDVATTDDRRLLAHWAGFADAASNALRA